MRKLALIAFTFVKYVGTLGAMGTDESRHVLDNARHFQFCFDAKVDFSVDVLYGRHLGCGDEYARSPFHCVRVVSQRLNERNVFVRGAGRSVDHQEVKVTPGHLSHELFDHRLFLGPAPDDRLLLLRQKANRDQLEHIFNGPN